MKKSLFFALFPVSSLHQIWFGWHLHWVRQISLLRWLSPFGSICRGIENTHNVTTKCVFFASVLLSDSNFGPLCFGCLFSWFCIILYLHNVLLVHLSLASDLKYVWQFGFLHNLKYGKPNPNHCWNQCYSWEGTGGGT